MARPLCKVCGLTREEDVRLCHELGVDFTGFIFVPSSPRKVSPEFVAKLPAGASGRVGVFSGFTPEEVIENTRQAGLDLIQLHGGESPEFCAAVGTERVIKVLWPESCTADELRRQVNTFAPFCAYFLLDAGKGGGGSGKTLQLDPALCANSPRPLILAGGLGPDNLRGAINAYQPHGVDLNSALEISPGIKDPEKIRRAVDILNNSPEKRATS